MMTDLTTEPSGAATVSRARRWAALAVLSASLLIIAMDMTILNIALPQMAAQLTPTATQQLWMVDIYSLILAGLLVTCSAIADRWGRKRMLLLGYAIFGIASVLVLVADSAEAVIAIRALLGLGGAMIMPTTLSMIRVIFTDPGERATALSIWAAVAGLGAAFGPLVGGFLLEHFSWHSAFLINVPFVLAGIVAGAMILPESRVAHPGRLDALGAVLSLVGMLALVWAIKDFGKQASLVVPEAWAALALAVVSLAWFVARSLRSDQPLLDLRLFGSRQFSAGIIAALVTTFSLVAAMLLMAQWLQIVNGSSPIEAGLRLAPAALAGAVASVSAPPLARLIGARTVLTGGLVLAGIGMLVLGVAPGGMSATVVMVSLILVGAGTGSLAIGSAMIMGGTPQERAGNAGALEETSYELGGTLGVAVLGSISALAYRSELDGLPALGGLDPSLAAQAQESVGAAAAVADRLGLPALAQAAGEAFTGSLQLSGWIGGGLILTMALVVFVLTPKGTSVSGGH